jgi:hypothetical protein
MLLARLRQEAAEALPPEGVGVDAEAVAQHGGEVVPVPVAQHPVDERLGQRGHLLAAQ